MTQPTEWEKKEVWKSIPKTENIEVSNMGRIRRKGKVYLGTKHSQGYFCTSFNVDGRRSFWKVHRLVMLAFVGPSAMDVNHKNGVKDDNRLSNLEYVTRGQNQLHAFSTGLKVPCKGSANGRAKLNDKLVKEIRQIQGISNVKIGRIYGISDQVVGRVRNRQTWKHVE